MSEIMELTPAVGFPIVCFFLMLMNNRENRKIMEEYRDKWLEAINNNTLALEKISIMLKGV